MARKGRFTASITIPRRIARATEGSEIAEAALVLPIVFTLLMAIIWFGRGFNIYSTVTFAAREGASVYVKQGCATCSTTAPTASDVVARVTQVLQASHIDPGQIQACSTCTVPVAGTCGGMTTTSDPSGVTVYANAQLNTNGDNPPACGVVVNFQYPFNVMSVPFTVLGKTISFKADAQMQAEN